VAHGTELQIDENLMNSLCTHMLATYGSTMCGSKKDPTTKTIICSKIAKQFFTQFLAVIKKEVHHRQTKFFAIWQKFA